MRFLAERYSLRMFSHHFNISYVYCYGDLDRTGFGASSPARKPAAVVNTVRSRSLDKVPFPLTNTARIRAVAPPTNTIAKLITIIIQILSLATGVGGERRPCC